MAQGNTLISIKMVNPTDFLNFVGLFYISRGLFVAVQYLLDHNTSLSGCFASHNGLLFLFKGFLASFSTIFCLSLCTNNQH